MTVDYQYLRQLQSLIERANARWQSGPTSVLYLDEKTRRFLCGCIRQPVPPGAVSAPPPVPPPPRVDWRDRNGQSFVTPIRNQEGCGTCVGFSTAATIESRARIATQTPTNGAQAMSMPILSPAAIFFCTGGKCEGGMAISTALNYVRDTGLCPESCFPYAPNNQPCNITNGGQYQRTQLLDWSSIKRDESGTLDPMKAALNDFGPLVANLDIYRDFHSYRGGVYSHVDGPLEGSHAVEVIGYDDAAQAWICKNSWGTGWGENGFFQIAYGQCKIDDEMWSPGAFSSIWTYPRLTLGTSMWYTEGDNPTGGISIDATVESHKAGGSGDFWYAHDGIGGNFTPSVRNWDNWGKQPNVACNDRGDLILVSGGVANTRLYYQRGTLTNASVTWANQISYFDDAYYPSAVVNNHGVVVAVYQGYGTISLWFKVGTLDSDGKGITWGESIWYGAGYYAAVAINDSNEVVVVNQSPTEIMTWYQVGTVDPARKLLELGAANRLGQGYFPRVALDNRGRVITVHQSHLASEIWYRTGRLVGNGTGLIALADPVKYGDGFIPNISMNNNGDVLEVHKSQANLGLWRHNGRLED